MIYFFIILGCIGLLASAFCFFKAGQNLACILALMFGLAGCAETVQVTYRDGSQETYQATGFHCQPAGCLESGVARSVSFCVGFECMIITDFDTAVHTWYDLAGTPGPVSENKIEEVTY